MIYNFNYLLLILLQLTIGRCVSWDYRCINTIIGHSNSYAVKNETCGTANFYHNKVIQEDIENGLQDKCKQWCRLFESGKDEELRNKNIECSLELEQIQRQVDKFNEGKICTQTRCFGNVNNNFKCRSWFDSKYTLKRGLN